MDKPLKLVIAGGKTGGHLFPGIAVAQAVQQVRPDTQIRFVGTNAPFETRTLEEYGYPHTAIGARPIKGKGLVEKAKAAAAVGLSTSQALVILLGFRPDFVLGVGGFSSFSVVLAARILGIPTAIQEQNAFPGITNRMLAKFTRTIFTGFEETRGFSQLPNTVFTGNPVRLAGPGQPLTTGDTAQTEDALPDREREALLPGSKAGDFILLVTGGSQGAASINQALVDALPRLSQMENLYVVHQTGTRDQDEVKAQYRNMGIRSRVADFFQDMPAIQDQAHLVICRSGAGTVSELCLKGLPAVLIPFPHAADDHQNWNAKAMEAQGAARRILDNELSGRAIGEIIMELKADHSLRQAMAEKAEQMGMPHSAQTIAQHIINSRNGSQEGKEALHVSN